MAFVDEDGALLPHPIPYSRATMTSLEDGALAPDFRDFFSPQLYRDYATDVGRFRWARRAPETYYLLHWSLTWSHPGCESQVDPPVWTTQEVLLLHSASPAEDVIFSRLAERAYAYGSRGSEYGTGAMMPGWIRLLLTDVSGHCAAWRAWLAKRLALGEQIQRTRQHGDAHFRSGTSVEHARWRRQSGRLLCIWYAMYMPARPWRLEVWEPWSPAIHSAYPLHARRQAYRMLLLGNRLASRLGAGGGGAGAFMQVWVAQIMPLLVGLDRDANANGTIVD